MEKVLPVLKSFGISPEKITLEKIEKIKKLDLDYNNVESFSEENCQTIMDILDINLEIPKKPEKKIKIPRNSQCPCGSGIKYKKCCNIKTND
jgi:uncharacterized protein YecA (UPF0149 family)